MGGRNHIPGQMLEYLGAGQLTRGSSNSNSFHADGAFIRDGSISPGLEEILTAPAVGAGVALLALSEAVSFGGRLLQKSK